MLFLNGPDAQDLAATRSLASSQAVRIVDTDRAECVAAARAVQTLRDCWEALCSRAAVGAAEVAKGLLRWKEALVAVPLHAAR
eukprot:13438721-Alexandrium_andersonii.AAC.1